MASPDEAALAVASGADAVGLVSAMPSGPGVIDETTILAIARTVPPAVASVLLTAERDPTTIVAQVRRLRVNTVQLVDALAPGAHVVLRDALPGVGIVQVLHVRDRSAVDEARALDGRVDAILLDSGNPDAAVKELGGTGRVHDWSVSREVVSSVDVPVFLAGGLRAGNVAEAIDVVRPYGVDVCSGVRTGGALDPVKLRAFMEAVES